MTLYYLDSSAWVKRYYRETGTAWIESLFAQRQPVACASLGVIEVTAARELTRDLALRGADAVHLASALLLKGQLAGEDQLVLVTSDRELNIAAQSFSLPVVDPGQVESAANQR